MISTVGYITRAVDFFRLPKESTIRDELLRNFRVTIHYELLHENLDPFSFVLQCPSQPGDACRT